MKIYLVKCAVQDLTVLLNIARLTFREAFEEQNNPDDFRSYMDRAFNEVIFKEQLQHADSSYYFIKTNGSLVGYLKLNENQAQNEQFDASSIELERLYIQSNFQGQNIGQQVLQKVIHLAKEKGVSFLWLGVWEKNHNAIRFYERSGFKKFGAHPYFLGNDQQTDYLMKFDLTPPLLS